MNRKLSSSEIREIFLKYFERNGHLRMRSSSLLPQNDPTLLFTNAGMNQFKEVFTGVSERPAPCATTVQKCMRVSGKHNDLENVGRTGRHHTFFEMLGNFSFGHYFKREAIRYGWEMLTVEVGLPVDKLWVTVFEEDDEAWEIWAKDMGVSEDRIIRMGAKDNFWSMGETGPCGPCSEIHFDQGDGPNDIWKGKTIGCDDSDRFLELWNLVFMQYEQRADGSRVNLPKPSIDTGGGLERWAAVCQGVYSNYGSDLFMPLIDLISGGVGKKYGADQEDDVSMQVIADHARSAAFTVGDGAIPSNEFRGYVLRRIMRRAIRHGKRLGYDRVFMPEVCDKVISMMGDVYPELRQNRDFILKVVSEEEKGFRRTLDTGLAMLDDAVAKVKASGSTILPGEVIFKLYDTYGFPVDLTRLIVEERGLGLDEARFQEEMEKQRERGRASWKGATGEGATQVWPEVQRMLPDGVAFKGYESLNEKATLKAIVKEGRLLESLSAGEEAELVFDITPFYAESGGQVGDTGIITGDAAEFEVTDTYRPVEGVSSHKGRLTVGEIKTGQTFDLLVDGERRNHIRRNHSATHVLQYALRSVLGSHVKQKGSYVSPDRLRFDFTHFQAITPDEIERIEALVNEKIYGNTPVNTDVKSLADAQAEGALAFFDEKYGDIVRVVKMPPFSMELCGGTHVAHTGDIGAFTIVSESSIASGVRRIESATGKYAVQIMQEQRRAAQEAAGLLSISVANLKEGVAALMESQKRDQKLIEQLKIEKASAGVDSLIDKAEVINGAKVLCAALGEVEGKALREIGQKLIDKIGSGIVMLASEFEGKLNLLLAVSAEYRAKLPAGKTIGVIGAEIGVRGGGRPEMAQAGGGEPSSAPKAFDKLREIVSSTL